MTRNIDEQIRIYYTQQVLSPEALERLRSLTAKPEAPRETTLRMWQTLAMAATVAVAFLAGILFVAKSPTTTAPDAVVPVATIDVSNRVAQEVANRHHNCKHVDFTAADLAALAAAMTNLDFALTVPDGVDMSRLKLQGAHYCVINGQLALHATYVDQNGATVSLLETRTSSQFASMKHAMHEVDDVEVEIWRKDEVIIAMARPLASV